MKTIVVLGAGLAAAPVIRQVMRSVVLARKDVRIIVVAPTTHFLWPIAMPRAVVPGQLDDDKVMFPLEPLFAEYPADRFEFVLGRAVALDPSARTVNVALNGGGGGGGGGAARVVAYDALVIATGASAKDDMPWKTLDTTARTVERLHSLQKDIGRAKTIVVAGGGLTGVETAAELGFEYAKSGAKDVYLVHGGDLPLAPPTPASVRKQAKRELDKMGVRLVANTTVASATPSASGGDIVVELRGAGGTTTSLTAQAYIPATGVLPNTSFAPASMLDSRGFIKQTKSLQAEGHADIFVIGDAGSLEASRAAAAEAQAKHLITALPAYIDGRAVPEYAVNTTEMAFVTLGRSRATGHVGSFKLFSFMVWYLKGRFLGTDYAPRWAAGKKTMTTTLEK